MACKLVLVGMLSLAVTQRAPTSAGMGPPADLTQLPPLPLKPAPKVQLAWDCNGFVTAVDKDSVTVRTFDVLYGGRFTESRNDDGLANVFTGDRITLRWSNGFTLTGIRVESTRDTITVTASNGVVTTLRLADQLPRRFLARGPLAAGGFAKDAPRSYTYRLSDIRVGDQVGLSYVRINGVDYVETIGIGRRPGGRVPPAPGDVRPPGIPASMKLPPLHHELMNACQDWEERGIPLPAEFATYGSRLHPPYPPRAPMPREVPPRPAP